MAVRMRQSLFKALVKLYAVGGEPRRKRRDQSGFSLSFAGSSDVTPGEGESVIFCMHASQDEIGNSKLEPTALCA